MINFLKKKLEIFGASPVESASFLQCNVQEPSVGLAVLALACQDGLGSGGNCEAVLE
jgi:hypothetical protein